MSKNLPVKSRGKGIQRAHIRRYESGKAVAVNKGNNKVKRNVGVSKRVSKPVDRIVPKFSSLFDKKGLVDSRKFTVKKVDFDYLVTNREKNELEQVSSNLRPGSFLAKDIKIVHKGFTNMVDVHYTDVESGKRKVIYANQMIRDFVEYLSFFSARNIPVVFNSGDMMPELLDSVSFLPSFEGFEPDLNDNEPDDAIYDFDENSNETPLNTKTFESYAVADAYRNKLLGDDRMVIMYNRYFDSGTVIYVEDHGPRRRIVE